MKVFIAIIMEPNAPVIVEPTVRLFINIEDRNKFIRDQKDRMHKNGKGGLVTRMTSDMHNNIVSLECYFQSCPNTILEMVVTSEAEL